MEIAKVARKLTDGMHDPTKREEIHLGNVALRAAVAHGPGDRPAGAADSMIPTPKPAASQPLDPRPSRADSIFAQLLILGAIGLLPLLGFGIYLLFRADQVERTSIEAGLEQRAVAVSNAVDRLVETQIRVLETWRSRPRWTTRSISRRFIERPRACGSRTTAG
jgi:hypothetical protein